MCLHHPLDHTPLFLRIPTQSDTDSETPRTPVPGYLGQFSERSDAVQGVIKKCPRRVKF